MPVPAWVHDAIFYQIFPDRFANGDPKNDPPNVKPWNVAPTGHGFQGGDLRGIIHGLDYLLDLGINAIYLNPIFESPSTHRYNTTNYYRIDPKLGTLDDFRDLITIAHRNGLRIILDGVFNHCGRGFFAFNDILENGEQSPYRDWFHVKHYPPDAFSPGDVKDYLGWWNHKSLPKFNTHNQHVRQYIYDVARYWIDQGIDGWRLDVPNEIDDDDFWCEFRQVVKNTNEQAYLVGEIWNADPRWANDTHFDGLMNYPVRDALLNLLISGGLEVSNFASKVENILVTYPRENVHAMYVPLGSHDTERLMSKLNGITAKAKLAFLFLFAYPGAPAIYYGDEIGLMGGKDPDCRHTFPWDQHSWNMDLRNWVKTLVSLRNRCIPLRLGEYLRLSLDDTRGLYAFTRMHGEEKLIIAINASDHSHEFQIPTNKLGTKDGNIAQDLLDYSTYPVVNGNVQVSLRPWSGILLSL